MPVFYARSMSDGDELRDVLLAHSDHRACRSVFQAYTGEAEADLAEYLADREGLRPVIHEDTPFAEPEALASLGHRIRP